MAIDRWGWLGVALILVCAPWVIQRRAWGLSYDSFSYLSAAHNVTQGRGLVLSQVDCGAGLEPRTDCWRPLTQWPPLFPLAVAGVMHLLPAAPPTVAGWAVAYLSVVMTMVLCVRLARGLGCPLPPLLLALAVASMPVLTPLAMRVWSEGLALLCLLATHASLDRLLRDDLAQVPRRTRVSLVLWTLAGCYTRYAFWSVPFAVAAVITLFGRGARRERWAFAGAYLAATLLGLVPWIAHNLLTSGYWDGKAPRPGRGLDTNLADAGAYLVGRGMPSWLGWTMLAALVILVWRCRAPGPEATQRVRIQALVLSALVQLGLLLATVTLRFNDPLQPRLLAPITVLLTLALLIQGGLLLQEEWRTHAGPRLAAGCLGALALLHLGSALVPNLPHAVHTAPALAQFLGTLPAGAVYGGPGELRALQLAAPDHRLLLGLQYECARDPLGVTAETICWAREAFALEYLVFDLTHPGATTPGAFLEWLRTAPVVPPGIGELHEGPGWRVIHLAPPRERYSSARWGGGASYESS